MRLGHQETAHSKIKISGRIGLQLKQNGGPMKTYMVRSWRDLCEEAEAEADLRKFQKLAQQISRLLHAKLAHLKTRQAKGQRIR